MNVCFFLQKYKEFERAVRVEEIDGLRLVKRLAEDMEEMFHKKAQAMKVLVFLLGSQIASKLKYNATQQNQMYVMYCCAVPRDKLKLCNSKERVFFRCVGRSVTEAKSAGLRSVKSLFAVVISDHCADPIGCLKRCCHVTLPQCNKTRLGFAVCERDM